MMQAEMLAMLAHKRRQLDKRQATKRQDGHKERAMLYQGILLPVYTSNVHVQGSR